MKIGDLVRVRSLAAGDDEVQVGVIIRMFTYWAGPDEYVLEIKSSKGEMINAHSSCVEVINESRG